MKHLFVITLILSSMTIKAQSGVATTTKKTFSRTTVVSIAINADASTVFNILTAANNYPTWNSTIVSIDGNIAEGEKIKLTSTLDTSRTFKLKIKSLEPNSKMVWGDAMGERTFTIEKTNTGVIFTMSEKIGSFMFPLFAGKIPSFDGNFEQFAADLKTEAEK